jgi:hypothetical protein
MRRSKLIIRRFKAAVCRCWTIDLAPSTATGEGLHAAAVSAWRDSKSLVEHGLLARRVREL